jgi:hypothetical protein
MQKIRITEFFFENRLLWTFDIGLLILYSMHLRLNLSTTPDLKFYNPVLFSVALRPIAGHGLLIYEVFRSHTTTQHSR